MSNSLDTLIAELRKQVDAATPGPWENEDQRERGAWRSSGLIWSRNRGDYHPGTPICRMDEREVTEENVTQFEANAAFIAAARTLVPALLDALQLARELLRNEVLVSDPGAQADVDSYDDEIAKRLRGEAT